MCVESYNNYSIYIGNKRGYIGTYVDDLITRWFWWPGSITKKSKNVGDFNDLIIQKVGDFGDLVIQKDSRWFCWPDYIESTCTWFQCQ